MTELAKYFHESNWKIREWKNRLKNDKNLTPKEKQKYRNKISAQISRVKKKQEVDELQNLGLNLKAQLEKLSKILDEELSGEQRTRVLSRLTQLVPEFKGGKGPQDSEVKQEGKKAEETTTGARRKRKTKDKQQD
jgi:hypothetical protein